MSCVVVAVDSDRLYPPRLSAARSWTRCPGPSLHTVHSDYGHDGFLIEVDQVAALVDEVLRTPA